MRFTFSAARLDLRPCGRVDPSGDPATAFVWPTTSPTKDLVFPCPRSAVAEALYHRTCFHRQRGLRLSKGNILPCTAEHEFAKASAKILPTLCQPPQVNSNSAMALNCCANDVPSYLRERNFVWTYLVCTYRTPRCEPLDTHTCELLPSCSVPRRSASPPLEDRSEEVSEPCSVLSWTQDQT